MSIAVPGALNYSTHAVEDLLDKAGRIRERGGFDQSAAAMEQMAGLLARAVKFNLPPGGELVQLSGLDQSFAPFVRLPFDAVALESPWPLADSTIYEGDDHFRETPSSKRIAVCWTTAMSNDFPALCPEAPPGGFYVGSVYYDDDSGHWLLCPAVNYIPKDPEMHAEAGPPTDAAERIEREFLLRERTIKDKAPGVACYLRVISPEFVAAMAQVMKSLDDAKARLSIDLRDETQTAIEFCLTINSSNVKRERLAPPERLNRKREKNGKPPFFEAWILDLAPPRPADGAGRVAQGAPGERASPRRHLRRGHVRRLDAERITFVRATTVGSGERGLVEKVYRQGPATPK